jgi:hypothetical protein
VDSNQLCSFTGLQGHKFLELREKTKPFKKAYLDGIPIGVKHNYLPQYCHKLPQCISGD